MIILGFLLMLSGLLVPPLFFVGLLVLLAGFVIKAINRQGKATRRQMAAGEDRRPRRPCPKCSELVLDTASQCHHCGQPLTARTRNWLWGPVAPR